MHYCKDLLKRNDLLSVTKNRFLYRDHKKYGDLLALLIMNYQYFIIGCFCRLGLLGSRRIFGDPSLLLSGNKHLSTIPKQSVFDVGSCVNYLLLLFCIH